ncbi:cell surface complex protein, CscC family, partial [Lacticaseibacillus rhamnosus]
QMPSVASGTAAKLQFSLPGRVKHHALLNSTLFHDKPIGTVTGEGPTYDLKTPTGKDVLEYILDPETGDLTLEKVPSFIFELKDGAGGYRNPNVIDMVNGIP